MSSAGASNFAGCALGAALVSIYFVAGGLLSSAYVNLVQLGVKLAGFALVSAHWRWRSPADGTAIAADPSRIDLLAGGSPQSGWRLLFFLGPAFIVSPGLMQKALGARDERAVTTGIALNGVVLIAFAARADDHRHVGAGRSIPDISRDLAFADDGERR